MELLKWLVEEKGLDVQEWNKVFYNNCCMVNTVVFTIHKTSYN